MVEGKLMMSEILLKPTIEIHNELFRNKAKIIIKKVDVAHLLFEE